MSPRRNNGEKNGYSVLAIHHGIELPVGAQEPECGMSIDGQRSASPQYTDAVDDHPPADWPASRPVNHVTLNSAVHPSRGNLMHVLLGAAGLGVLDVAPVEHQYVLSSEPGWGVHVS